MITLDAIVGNEDRHLNNFGFVFNMREEVYKTAPIFDTGASLLAWVDEADLSRLSKIYIHDKAKPFRTTHKKQLKLVGDSINLEHIKYLAVIKSVEDILEYLSPQRAKAVWEYLKWRCEYYVNIT